jgi:hypothetical protein
MAYTKLNWMQIGGLLRENMEATEFTVETSNATARSQESIDHLKFDQIEASSYAININIDVDLAYEAIQQDKGLMDCLADAHVEFCS